MANKIDLKVGLKDETQSGWRGIMSGASGALGNLKGMIAGAFSAAAVTSFARSVIAYADTIKNASEATGIGVESFQLLAAQARENGVETEKFETSLLKLRAAMDDVGSNDKVEAVFKKLGMTVNEVRSADIDQVLVKIGQGVKDAVLNFSDLKELFGKGGMKLGPALTEIAGGMDALKGKFKGIMSDADITTINESEHSLQRLWNVVKSFSGSAAAVAIQKVKYDVKQGGGWKYAAGGIYSLFGGIDKFNEARQDEEDAAWEKNKKAADARRIAAINEGYDEEIANEDKAHLKRLGEEVKKAARDEESLRAKEEERIASEKDARHRKLQEASNRVLREAARSESKTVSDVYNLVAETMRKKAAGLAAGSHVSEGQSSYFEKKAMDKKFARDEKQKEKDEARYNQEYEQIRASLAYKKAHGYKDSAYTPQEIAMAQSDSARNEAQGRRDAAKQLEIDAQTTMDSMDKHLAMIEEKLDKAISIAE